MKILIVLGIILGIILILVTWIIKSYNSLVQSNELVKNSMGQIAAQIESRWDALKSLIQATKNYSQHESETLDKIVKSRGGVNSNSSVQDIEKDSNMFSNMLQRLAVVVEAYPDLKASNLYTNTMDKIDSYEQDVKYSRMIFNDTVTKFNRQLLVFPTVFIGRMLGFKEYEYFKNTEEKKDMPSWE